MIKVETHFHTGESSFCARISAAQGIAVYKDIYDAIIVTDHFARYSHNQMPHLSYEGYVNWWLTGYNKAFSAGEKYGVKVFLGMEITPDNSSNDYLIYGISKEILLANNGLFAMNEGKLKQFSDDNNLLMFQAHPFRPYITVCDPKNVHGVETFNGNPRHDNNNDKSLAFAEKHHLMHISGSDFHKEGDEYTGGIAMEHMPKDNADFVEMLKNREYSCLK